MRSEYWVICLFDSSVAEHQTFKSTALIIYSPRYIRTDQYLNASITTSGCAEHADRHVVFLEHVVVKVLIAHPRRGDLQISLISPSGTRSQLLAKR